MWRILVEKNYRLSRTICHYREVIETVTYPSRLDVEPISGVLSFIDGQATQSLNISALDDVEAESNEVFSIILITGKGGARISSTDSLAKLTGMLLNDIQRYIDMVTITTM